MSLRRWLCGRTPWTPHEYVLRRRQLHLFEAICCRCGDHRWGHVDHARLLPWTIQTEAEWADIDATPGASSSSGAAARGRE